MSIVVPRIPVHLHRRERERDEVIKKNSLKQLQTISITEIDKSHEPLNLNTSFKLN